ncbi:twitching motility protein PilT [Actinomycetota bacterium]|nr:twitching motility protein PilT [Actinomycetota bacterium]
MRILADTHVLLWWLADDEVLAPWHRDALADGRNDVYFSAVTVAEIAVKASLGKIDAPADVAGALTDGGFTELPFTAEHAVRLRDLPWHHLDPFDRMLACQAAAEGLTVATVDGRFQSYGVPIL